MAGPAIHTYRAAEPGLSVNSYLVEAESGVVVVDTSLLVSDIEALRARLGADAVVGGLPAADPAASGS